MAIVYQNRGWIVTEALVATVPGMPDYEFEIDRVLEQVTRSSQRYYDWPVHMAEKTWVDVALFIDAFDRAINYQSGKTGEAIDSAMLAASYTEALRIEKVR